MQILPKFLIFSALLATGATEIWAGGFEAVAPEWNFGAAESCTTVTNVFELRNAESTSLTVRTVRSSCSCTAADYPKNAVPPGSSVCLRVTLKLPEKEGPIHKRITVEWQAGSGKNGGKNGETDLVLKGDVRRLAWLEPPAANFGVCPTGAVAEA